MLSSLRFFFFFFALLSSSSSISAQPGPYAMRISCGANHDLRTPPTNTRWNKDFAYTGGVSANATLTSFISPPLKTVRHFRVSDGPNNCYNFDKIPSGLYQIRIFFGLVAQPSFDLEPLFDISIDGTQVYSLESGWSSQDYQAYTEAIVLIANGGVTICFHSTGHGDPTILSIEILQVDDKAYHFGPQWGNETILRTNTRLNCGTDRPGLDADYGGKQTGGDRLWAPIKTFTQDADQVITTLDRIKLTSIAPNFYPEAIYQSAIVSTDIQPDLEYTMDVNPNSNYSVWLHFAEIDNSITAVDQRVFDILINGDTAFSGVDIIKMSGDRFAALVLNTTVSVNGRTMTITVQPKDGSRAIINAIEVFEIIPAESRTLLEEVTALQRLKSALALPLRFGWNGDPCVPQQHPWTGAVCELDKTSGKWFIDGLDLNNQGLKGLLPDDMSKLRHLQSLNLSENSIRGAIPSSLGNITSLEILDLSYNLFNGTIPESLGQLNSLRVLNLNGNSLKGRVPGALGGRLLHGASFNFTDNAGLCGIPGLRSCGPHLSAGGAIGVAIGVFLAFLIIILASVIWWKRRQNILRAKQLAERGAPYAKARTHTHDIQLTRHHYQGHNHNHNHNQGHQHHGHVRTASKDGSALLS